MALKASKMALNIRQKATSIEARRLGTPSQIDYALPDTVKDAVIACFKAIGDYAILLGHKVPDELHDIGNELNKTASKGERIFDPTSMILQAVSMMFANGSFEYNVSVLNNECVYVCVCMYVCMCVCVRV